MSSDALVMFSEMRQLVTGRIPDTRKWKGEIPPPGGVGASRNKPLVCATAEGYHAFLTARPARVLEMLGWWVWFCGQPFTDGEELTPEEVYRAMMLYSAFGAAALARKVGHQEAEAACLAYCRAHVGWLALGAGAGAGKKVTDHHLGDVTKPCVLVGDGGFISALPYVAQAGMRGWIRNRDGGPQTFHFTDASGLSVALAQAAGLGYDRRLAPAQDEALKAAMKFAPSIPPLGFNDAQRRALLLYLADPAVLASAVDIVALVAYHCPNDDFEFVRHADASVEVYMLENHSSSTDDRMVDAWRAGGGTAKASADDGLRSSHLHMTAREEGGQIVVEGGGRSVSVQMSSSPIAWRASARSGAFSFWTPATEPPPAPAPDPTRPSTQRESRSRSW